MLFISVIFIARWYKNNIYDNNRRMCSFMCFILFYFHCHWIQHSTHWAVKLLHSRNLTKTIGKTDNSPKWQSKNSTDKQTSFSQYFNLNKSWKNTVAGLDLILFKEVEIFQIWLPNSVQCLHISGEDNQLFKVNKNASANLIR